MTSREIAEYTGKEHKNVKVDIVRTLFELELDTLGFQRIYFDSMNREQDEYALPKDLTLTLVSGYSAPMRFAIIKRWMELEAQAPAQVKVPTSFREALLLATEQQDTDRKGSTIVRHLDGTALMKREALRNSKGGRVAPWIACVNEHPDADELFKVRKGSKVLNPRAVALLGDDEEGLITADAPGMDLRAIFKDNEPWFVASDVCRALDMDITKGTAQWLRGLDSDEKETLRNSQAGRVAPWLTCVNESGLYSLILKSRKPEAKAFKKWVTSVVLPAIRKDGAYIEGEEKVVAGEMSEDELLTKVLCKWVSLAALHCHPALYQIR